VQEAVRNEVAGALLPVDVGHYVATAGHRMQRGPEQSDVLLILVTVGRGWWRIAGRTGEATRGSLIVLPPRQAHAYGANPVDPWTIWWAHWQGRDITRLLTGPVRLHPGMSALPDGGGAAVPAWAHLLAAVATAQDAKGLFATACAGWELLGRLASDAVSDTAASDPRILAVLRTIGETPRRSLSIAAAARLAGYSASHFRARFRAATGQSFAAWQQHRRLRHAALLLDTTGDGIAAIAAQSGYNDPFYFSRHFRALHGCSPSQWRQRRTRA
jgi:AraC family transcriptional regulator of arabinose operon